MSIKEPDVNSQKAQQTGDKVPDPELHFSVLNDFFSSSSSYCSETLTLDPTPSNLVDTYTAQSFKEFAALTLPTTMSTTTRIYHSFKYTLMIGICRLQ
jgi:hypothetical protein